MYYFYFTICYLFSLLPMELLFLMSDGIYFVVYHLAGYRKKVVMQNLLQAFPEKTPRQRIKIARKFYRNLTDMMVETIKLMSISAKSLEKRFAGDLSLLQELETSEMGYHIHLGHFFNWEWANLYIKTQVSLPFLVTYMPLSSRATDRLFRYIRGRFHSILIPATTVQTAMKPWQDAPYISVLVADQNPGKRRRSYWYPFMHKMTAFYKGPELSARRSNSPVVFGEIKKLKRGHYHITLKLISIHPKMEKEG